MKHLLICLLIGSLAVPALADQNPDIRIYLDADPNNHVHEIHPGPSLTFNVYVCLDCFGPGGGTRGTALRMRAPLVMAVPSGSKASTLADGFRVKAPTVSLKVPRSSKVPTPAGTEVTSSLKITWLRSSEAFPVSV